MAPRLASAFVVPALALAVLLALTFSSGGSAHVGSGSNSRTFPARNGAIVFLSGHGVNAGLDLYLMQPNGTHQRRITSGPGLEMSPKWSPDGKWIAFARGPQQRCAQIYRMRANGTALQRITHDRGCYTNPSWSPDGRRLTFVREQTPSGKLPVFALGTINVNGSGLRLLTHRSAPDEGPAWSPDGTTIAFVRSWPPAIWLMDADGTNQRQLTMPPQRPDIEEGEDAQPDWSPDGKWLAFSRAHQPHMGKTGSTRYRHDIYLIQPDGTELRQLTRLDGANISPTWSPDGKRIAFASDRTREDLTDIYVMNANGTQQQRLTHTVDSGSPDWQPQR